ncbi:MAG: sugar phosphate isomerase/epimerase [Verrucomicrobiales bacterium]|jgi:sugar phosphate isomerase/epimerase
MELNDGIHLAYCTNIHRGETWEETFAGLRDHTLRVKQRVSPEEPYAIGLRLGQQAAEQLAHGDGVLDAFRRWMDDHGCYVFTINGFPYGRFHGGRVKEQVYVPDWSTPERLDYTNLLFDLLAEMIPEGIEGSVSTLPGSFKEFNADVALIERNLKVCAEHIEVLSDRRGQRFHLGLEPEPLGLFETSAETLDFFEDHLQGDRLREFVGVNYDTCHLAIEYEDPREALGRLSSAGIMISKLHLSSALTLKPSDEALERLGDFQEDTYLHQVIVRDGGSPLRRYRDLPDALAMAAAERGEEWRVHFHIPLHREPELVFGTTADHLLGVLDALAANRSLCKHLEMETYTWEVMPQAMHSSDVVDQLEREYAWCLAEMRGRGLVG